MTEPQPFHVDLRGVVNLLSRHIYSSPRVYLRELIQNGVDAITARRKLTGADSSPTNAANLNWSIRILPSTGPGKPITVTDDGIGMSHAEVTELLATVGSSSKRDILDLPQTGLLGHFGIGMLSCFMLTEEIVVRSRSASGAPPIIWHGHSNGTFTVTEDPSLDLPIGTTVEFVPRADDRPLASPRSVWDLATTFAPYVETPVFVYRDDEWRQVNSAPLFARDFADLTEEEFAELGEFGAKVLGAPPLASIEIRVPGTDVAGTAFLLSQPRPPHRNLGHVAYLGGLLVSDEVLELTPSWAFFVRCVINTTVLTPTASREQFVRDETLTMVREGIGNCLKTKLQSMAANSPWHLEQFVAIHQLGLWSVAIHDDELAKLVIPWLPMETSTGTISLGAHLKTTSVIRYCETVREFQTVASLSLPGDPIINAGHTYEVPLLRRLPRLFEGVTVQKVTLSDALDAMAQAPYDDQAKVDQFRERALQALSELPAQVEVRSFDPADTPAFLIADPNAWRRHDQQTTKAAASGAWSELLDTLGPSSAEDTAPSNQVCFNWASPLVQSLAVLDDEVVATRTLRVLYLQAALASSRPLQPDEKEMANAALGDLISLSQFRSELDDQ